MKDCLTCGQVYERAALKCPRCGGSTWILARVADSSLSEGRLPRESRVRPLGVSVIAGLCFLVAAVFLLLLIAELAGSLYIPQPYGSVLAWLGGIYLLLGCGLWRLQGWAHKLFLALLILDGLHLIYLACSGHPLAFWRIALVALLLGYLVYISAAFSKTHPGQLAALDRPPVARPTLRRGNPV